MSTYELHKEKSLFFYHFFFGHCIYPKILFSKYLLLIWNFYVVLSFVLLTISSNVGPIGTSMVIPSYLRTIFDAPICKIASSCSLNVRECKTENIFFNIGQIIFKNTYIGHNCIGSLSQFKSHCYKHIFFMTYERIIIKTFENIYTILKNYILLLV